MKLSADIVALEPYIDEAKEYWRDDYSKRYQTQAKYMIHADPMMKNFDMLKHWIQSDLNFIRYCVANNHKEKAARQSLNSVILKVKLYLSLKQKNLLGATFKEVTSSKKEN